MGGKRIMSGIRFRRTYSSPTCQRTWADCGQSSIRCCLEGVGSLPAAMHGIHDWYVVSVRPEE